MKSVDHSSLTLSPVSFYSLFSFLIHFIELVAPTRFSSKPQHPNTFMNHQPGPKTPGFITESDRLGPKKDLNSTVGF